MTPGFRCLMVHWIYSHQEWWLLISGSGPTNHLKIAVVSSTMLTDMSTIWIGTLFPRTRNLRFLSFVCSNWSNWSVCDQLEQTNDRKRRFCVRGSRVTIQMVLMSVNMVPNTCNIQVVCRTTSTYQKSPFLVAIDSVDHKAPETGCHLNKTRELVLPDLFPLTFNL